MVAPRSKKQKRFPESVVIHILATFNNTLISAYDRSGNKLAGVSGGMLQKGARKATGPTAEDVCKMLRDTLIEHGVKEAEINIKGCGAGRDSSIVALGGRTFDKKNTECQIRITKIRDITPDAHNGVRRKKKKRN